MTAWSTDSNPKATTAPDNPPDVAPRPPDSVIKKLDQPIDSWGPDLQLRGVAHDMTTPAATVRLLAKLLNEETSDGRTRQLADQIIDEATHLVDLCTEVLEGGHVEELRVDHIAHGILAGMRLISKADISADLQPTLLTARSVSIERMFSNMLTNALKAAGPHGRVRAYVAPTEGGVIVAVENSGARFPESPDERALSSSTVGGTPRPALGLLIIDAIARQYKGRVDTERSDLGGAMVRVWIPALPQPRAELST